MGWMRAGDDDEKEGGWMEVETLPARIDLGIWTDAERLVGVLGDCALERVLVYNG